MLAVLALGLGVSHAHLGRERAAREDVIEGGEGGERDAGPRGEMEGGVEEPLADGRRVEGGSVAKARQLAGRGEDARAGDEGHLAEGLSSARPAPARGEKSSPSLAGEEDADRGRTWETRTPAETPAAPRPEASQPANAPTATGATVATKVDTSSPIMPARTPPPMLAQ